MYITKITRNVECHPCAICGNEDIHEYMIDTTYGYRMCDKCNISADAGSSATMSAFYWDRLMKKLEEVK